MAAAAITQMCHRRRAVMVLRGTPRDLATYGQMAFIFTDLAAMIGAPACGCGRHGRMRDGCAASGSEIAEGIGSVEVTGARNGSSAAVQ